MKSTPDLMVDLQDKVLKDGIQKVVVGAVIISFLEGKHHVLLLERVVGDFMGGLVELPSGGVDEGEKYLDALFREVAEETGLSKIETPKYIGSFDYLSGSGKKARQLNFLVVSRQYDVELNTSEHSQFFWLTESDVFSDRYRISPETKSVIVEGLRALDGH